MGFLTKSKMQFFPRCSCMQIQNLDQINPPLRSIELLMLSICNLYLTMFEVGDVLASKKVDILIRMLYAIVFFVKFTMWISN